MESKSFHPFSGFPHWPLSGPVPLHTAQATSCLLSGLNQQLGYCSLFFPFLIFSCLNSSSLQNSTNKLTYFMWAIWVLWTWLDYFSEFTIYYSELRTAPCTQLILSYHMMLARKMVCVCVSLPCTDPCLFPLEGRLPGGGISSMAPWRCKVYRCSSHSNKTGKLYVTTLSHSMNYP